MDWREAEISAGVGPGWEPLVDELHARVLELNPDVRVAQVKEKFGGLRYYVSGAPIRIDILGVGSYASPDKSATEAQKQIDLLISEYEERSFHTCEWCGTTEGVTTSAGAPGRWLKSLCPEHRRLWDEEKRWWSWEVT